MNICETIYSVYSIPGFDELIISKNGIASKGTVTIYTVFVQH